MAQEIFINRGGQQRGPFSLEDIKGQLAKGTIIAADLAWYEGMSEWKPVHALIAESSGSKSPALVAPSVEVATGSGGTAVLDRDLLDKQHENVKPVEKAAGLNYGKLVIPILLLLFWLFLAYRSFARHDMTRVYIFLGLGIVLTAWRVKKALE